MLNFRDCKIEYYDSLSGVDRLTINSLLQWAEDEYADKYGGDVPNRFRVRASWVLSLPAFFADQVALCLYVCLRWALAYSASFFARLIDTAVVCMLCLCCRNHSHVCTLIVWSYMMDGYC